MRVANFAFTLTGEPKLNLTFGSASCTAPEAISAPCPPESVALALQGAASATNSSSGRLSAELKVGTHELDFDVGMPLKVRVSGPTQAVCSWVIDTHEPQRPALKHAVLSFLPAIQAQNVVVFGTSSLQHLPKRWIDRIASVRQRIPMPIMAAISLALGSADVALVIAINEIALDASADDGKPRLRISGAIKAGNQPPIQFDDFQVPDLLLPELTRQLHALASDIAETFNTVRRAPLYSTLAPQLFDIVESFSLQMQANGLTPRIVLETKEADSTRTDCTVDPLGEWSANVAISGERSSSYEGLRLSTQEASITCAKHPLSVDISGQLHTDRKASLCVTCIGQLPPMHLSAKRTHPWVIGGTYADLHIVDTQASIGFRVEHTSDTNSIEGIFPWNIQGALAKPSMITSSDGNGELRTSMGGMFSAHAAPTSDNVGSTTTSGDVAFAVHWKGPLQHTIEAKIEPIFELGLDTGVLFGGASAKGELSLRALWQHNATNEAEIVLSGTKAKHELTTDARLSLDTRHLVFPAGSMVDIRVARGTISSVSMFPLDLSLRWNINGAPLLHAGALADPKHHEVSLLTRGLRKGRLLLRCNNRGRITVTGANPGFYGERFFNALLNPAADIEQWYRILTNDDAFSRVQAALRVFSSDGADRLGDIRQILLTGREIIRRENIRRLGDLIPRDRIAKTISLLLIGSSQLSAALNPIIRQVTEGNGLDVESLRALIARNFSEIMPHYETSWVLNWLDLVLRPGEPLAARKPEEQFPLVNDTAYNKQLSALPTAAEMYAWTNTPNADQARCDQLCANATELSLTQLEYILTNASENEWNAQSFRRMQRVLVVKRRVHAITSTYGGIEHSAQPFVVATLLGNALGNSLSAASKTETLSDVALGAQEVALLLQVGLARLPQQRRTQLNNRLLMHLLAVREPMFTRWVLLELAQQTPRTLTNVLYALLEQDQNHLALPVDVASLLSEKLCTEVPRQRDYLAGGRHASQSYYHALSQLADAIVADGASYYARKAHLQEVQHPIRCAVTIESTRCRSIAERAQNAIFEADRAGQHYQQHASAKTARAAKIAYQRSFDSCAELLRHEKQAFQLDWFKQFWRRNEEALRVLSVVRAYQNNTDQVRKWVTIRGGVPNIADEQQLIESVIGTLYWHTTDQQQLRADPLVRLLIEPPNSQYAFTIVSCMGVITRGAQGSELELAFDRIRQSLGINIIRANTGTGRSLEYNADRIVKAIEQCKTPWGLVGYSQGCANALLAESTLHSGTPTQQRLLDKFVGRNFLFSAANGSPHGSSSMLKFTRAMVQAECSLKHYQATHSWAATRAALRAMRSVIDSELLVGFIGGTYSLTYERAKVLHRDGQFRDDVPTSTTRAIATPDRIPETLEYAYHTLRKLCGGLPQDSQVLESDAIGSASRIRNTRTDALTHCDIGSMVQATHHWAPLRNEVEFVTTKRDRDQAVYESPLDQLIWPWVQVHARFGRIQPRSRRR